MTVDRFFVSYNGVLTLAYRAFSRTLLEVKARLEHDLGDVLKAENPGSQWPKTTLAGLIHDRPLSDGQVMMLRRMCAQYTCRLQALSPAEKNVPVNELKLVVMGNRAQEKRLEVMPIRLHGPRLQDDRPSRAHENFVAAVMAEFDESRHADYYPRLAPDGRTVDAYYRTDHVETTVVADVVFDAEVVGIIDGLRRSIEGQWPGCYGWFDPARWHLTIRALMPR